MPPTPHYALGPDKATPAQLNAGLAVILLYTAFALSIWWEHAQKEQKGRAR